MQDFSDLPVYVLPAPPYVLLAIGLFAGATAGFAFNATLVQGVQDWRTNRTPGGLLLLTTWRYLFTPFLGIFLGIALFLAAGLEIFGFFPPATYVLSIVLSVGTAWLLWYQLGVALKQIERGGSRALDLDSWD